MLFNHSYQLAKIYQLNGSQHLIKRDITLSVVKPSLALPRLDPDLPSAIEISLSKSHPLWGCKLERLKKLCFYCFTDTRTKNNITSRELFNLLPWSSFSFLQVEEVQTNKAFYFQEFSQHRCQKKPPMLTYFCLHNTRVIPWSSRKFVFD